MPSWSPSSLTSLEQRSESDSSRLLETDPIINGKRHKNQYYGNGGDYNGDGYFVKVTDSMRRISSMNDVVKTTTGPTTEQSTFASLRVLNFPNEDEDDSDIVPLHETVSPRDMSSTFLEDCRNFTPGSMPHSTVVGISIGVFCGIVAYLYYTVLEYLLDLLWHELPHKYVVPYLDPSLHWLWIPVLGLAMALGVGLSVRLLGEPGDLSYTVQCVHDKAFIDMSHVLPMLAASQFSILGGGSLGPEAPLVAICASFSGFISRKIFRQTRRTLIRKHTLMGMACALAAFFGVPLGGSLFALEINNRFGIEYYEHTMEAIFSGTVCLCVFRGLAGIDMGSIWEITTKEEGLLQRCDSMTVLRGALFGLMGAGVAALFASFHKGVMGCFRRLGLLEQNMTVPRAIAGSSVMLLIGVLVPQTMFWGESEFETIATASPASSLAHVFPSYGLLGFEMNSFSTAMIVGVAKMIAISFTVGAGYRGGFIFPFFAAGAAFGKGLAFLFPGLSPGLTTLCIAAGINVAITRTALATPLILCQLAGEINAGPPVLAASMVSLFVTSYMPFIRSQVKRADVQHIQSPGPQRTPPKKQRGEASFDDPERATVAETVSKS